MTPLETLRSFGAHDHSLWGLLASRAARAPAPFLLHGGTVISYGEFVQQVATTAAALSARGVAAGDRVAAFGWNDPGIVCLLFALARLDAVLVPINPELPAAEAGYVLSHAGVCGVAYASEAKEAASAAAAELVPAPWLDAFCCLTRGDAHAATAATGSADAACVILYTSGTTGYPKGVLHSQRSFVIAGEGFVERMQLEPSDRLLAILPFFHVNALFYSLGGALAAGASLVLGGKFSASGFWRLAAESGATQVNIIAAVGNILARRSRSELQPHRIRKAYGAPVSAEIERVFREEFAVPTVREGYGMTEVPGVCNNPFDGPNRIGSMGKAAQHPDPTFPFAELRVVDESGRELADGEVGELVVRTPIAMLGYYREPEATAAAFTAGWFRTGDLVRRDADGYFWFVAREKDIIRRRGENVSGAELDRVIGEHPAVAEAAAIAIASELGEDEILVAVVPRAGHALTPSDIAAFCRERLARHKRPRFVALVDSLPRTPTERVAKFRLRSDPELRARAVEVAYD